jgi:hypothetical protein
MAACMVSLSRISPIRMQSGAWRMAFFSAGCQSMVSMPISRWLTIDFLCLKRYSIGSSTVRIWPARLAVAVIEHRGDGRRLAGAGGADDQDQAALLHDQSASTGGSRAHRAAWDVAEDEADDDADRAALAEDVDAEVADVRYAEGEVHLHLASKVLI